MKKNKKISKFISFLLIIFLLLGLSVYLPVWLKIENTVNWSFIRWVLVAGIIIYFIIRYIYNYVFWSKTKGNKISVSELSKYQLPSEFSKYFKEYSNFVSRNKTFNLKNLPPPLYYVDSNNLKEVLIKLEIPENEKEKIKTSAEKGCLIYLSSLPYQTDLWNMSNYVCLKPKPVVPLSLGPFDRFSFSQKERKLFIIYKRMHSKYKDHMKYPIYIIDQKTLSVTLVKLSLSDGVKESIKASVKKGKTVFITEAAYKSDDWKEEKFLAFDLHKKNNGILGSG